MTNIPITVITTDAHNIDTAVVDAHRTAIPIVEYRRLFRDVFNYITTYQCCNTPCDIATAHAIQLMREYRQSNPLIMALCTEILQAAVNHLTGDTQLYAAVLSAMSGQDGAQNNTGE